MTIRYFCDVCTEEVQDAHETRSFRTTVALRKPLPDHTPTRNVGIEIRRAIDGAWNAGHICNRCLRAALRQVRDELRSDA